MIALISLTAHHLQTGRIPLDLIRESVVALRLEYDEESLDELGGSIEVDGLIQPIVVQHADDGHYDLIIGSRRFRAAKKKGLADIPGYVIEPRSPVELLLLALAENLHRKDLNPFEEAVAFLRLMKEYGLDTQSIASRINKKEEYVRRRMELLGMPEEVQRLIADKKLPIQHVGVLARIASGAEQVELAHTAIENRLSTQELRTLSEDQLGAALERIRYELTPQKVKAHTEVFRKWLRKALKKMNFKSLNAAEKEDLGRTLDSLESEMRMFRSALLGIEPISPEKAGRVPIRTDDPRNHGQEWPAGDVALIMADDRPPDEVLARRLGRTVNAIEGMRYKVQRTK